MQGFLYFIVLALFRPKSFAVSPHAVILERSEEARGATPLENGTGGSFSKEMSRPIYFQPII